MKIAVPVNEDRKTVCVSFGRTPEFLFWDTQSGEKEYIFNEASVAEGGAGIQAAQLVVDQGAQVLLTPRCGENAAKVLNAASVKMYRTTSDDLEKELDQYQKDELPLLTEFHSGFHNHEFDK